MRLARGHRGPDGVWVPDCPSEYPPIDIHGIWPWSVLDATTKAWRDRRQWWDSQDVDDITPRAHTSAMISTGRHGRRSGGVSRFDPVLAELLVSWFCPPAGLVFDPMAGGPVRGIVATHLGRSYLGVDLLAAQVDANRETAARWGLPPTWMVGDARALVPTLDVQADYVLTCPPYWNRERYSDDPRDLSAMRWPEFLQAHHQIVAATLDRLRDDRFLTWVISDVRDSRGHLRHLPWIVLEQVESCGARLVNEQVLVEPAGLRAKTTRPGWEACRTTTRRHQYVLTFVKGDRRAAAAAVSGRGGAPC